MLLVPGIVINASRTRPRAVSVKIRCKGCGNERDLAVPPGFGGVTLPRTCPAL
jgi:DNA replication licensing factor MCM5